MAEAGAAGLLAPVRALREEATAARFPLDLPDAEMAESVRAALTAQLDDYLIPRLESIDAPLLAVVGGSTGAGKSTLVNSVIGSVVSRSGVLRPTTRAPVLVHHPGDEGWFVGTRILPGLARVTGTGGDQDSSAVRLVATETLAPGLALLDAPDIDSVVRDNRQLARQLLAAADLWVFVTTAARYADAVPWDLLREAGARGTSVAMVLNRVPRGAMDEVRDDLARLLREQGLGDAPLFAVNETSLTGDGLLPESELAPLRDWLAVLAGDAAARAEVVRRTLAGVVDSLPGRVAVVAAASRSQVTASVDLRAAAGEAFDQAVESVEAGMSDGSLLRGEVLARWQEFVGMSEFLRQVEAGVGRVRDRVSAAIRGHPRPPAERLGEALQSGVADLVTAHGLGASAGTVRQWRQLPGGRELVAGTPGLARLPESFDGDVARLVRDWQGEILQLVRSEGKDRRTTARVLAFGVNGVGVLLMLVTFAHTGGLLGAEVGIAGGTAVLAQKLLEAIFGDQAVRDLAAKSRQMLFGRVELLYDGVERRFADAVELLDIRADQADRLSAALAKVEHAR